MKIICVGRNYSAHAEELKNEIPETPVLFLKPETAKLSPKSNFYLPDFSSEIHYEAEIVVRIDRLGKNIAQKFAHKYYSQLSLGIDFTARDLQKKLKSKGLPWEKAKAFDGAAALGNLLDKNSYGDIQQLDFSLKINNEVRQKGNSIDMIFSIDALIAYISQFFTLKVGDLIFTGTPAGVGKINAGDQIEGFIKSEKVLELQVR